MALDDDLLGQMAEAAVAPEEGEGLAAEDRKTKVAEPKARLKAKRQDLEQGLAKIRKSGKPSRA